ncbi:MAG: DUF4340 domain-containing protein [Vicinamibacterales bacterium]
MRGFRSLLILLIIAIPVGWLTYRESRRAPGDDEPKKEKVFAVDSEKIEEIAIKSEAGEQTRLQKSADKGWQIVAPTTAQPDPAEVSGLTTNLSTLEVQRVVDENPPDLKEYGLSQPRIEVSFKSAGQQHTLLVGQKTPPGTDLYAKRAADNRVFLIPSHLEATFNKGTFDLRDKSVLKIDRDKLDALELETADRTTRFTKPGGGEWQIASPVKGRADFSAIESLVSRLTGLQMKSVVDDADQKKAGFQKPAATVRMGSGSSQATLVVGGPADEGTVYAKDLSRPLVFTIESSVLDELEKDPSEYRQKDLFDARSFNATRVEIVRAGETHGFEKTKTKNKEGQDEETWRQISPKARDLDQPSFDTLLTAITGARATSFVDAGTATKALAAPELAVTITFDEGKTQEKVAFAKSGTDAFAARSGAPGAAKIEPSVLDSITKALQELK